MTAACDSATVEALHRALGTRIEMVLARPYPGYLAYSEVVILLSEELSLRIDLVGESIAPKFEVFVARVRVVDAPTELVGWDRLELTDFVLANVFVLRREEWIEKIERVTQTTGERAILQKFGHADDVDVGNSVTVDAGLCFVSAHGAELSVNADTFPLVFQLRFEVASSAVTSGNRIAINRHRVAQ